MRADQPIQHGLMEEGDRGEGEVAFEDHLRAMLSIRDDAVERY